MKNFDLSLRGIVIGRSSTEDGKLVYKVLVTSAIQHNRAANRTFDRFSIVKVWVYPGNLTKEQIDFLKKEGAEATFNLTTKPEILVEDVTCNSLRPVRNLEEYVEILGR